MNRVSSQKLFRLDDPLLGLSLFNTPAHGHLSRCLALSGEEREEVVRSWCRDVGKGIDLLEACRVRAIASTDLEFGALVEIVGTIGNEYRPLSYEMVDVLLTSTHPSPPHLFLAECFRAGALRPREEFVVGDILSTVFRRYLSSSYGGEFPVQHVERELANRWMVRGAFTQYCIQEHDFQLSNLPPGHVADIVVDWLVGESHENEQDSIADNLLVAYEEAPNRRKREMVEKLIHEALFIGGFLQIFRSVHVNRLKALATESPSQARDACLGSSVWLLRSILHAREWDFQRDEAPLDCIQLERLEAYREHEVELVLGHIKDTNKVPSIQNDASSLLHLFAQKSFD